MIKLCAYLLFLISNSACCQTQIAPDSVVLIAEVMPEFDHGEGDNQREKLSSFIFSNLIIPQGLECMGSVYVEFIVEKDGSLSNISVLSGLPCEGYNEAVLAVVKSMPKWRPGLVNANTVRVKITIPIKVLKI